jgi:two-component system, chemotaxis family, protein-glutamate methylesterase/glutaminase
MTNGTSSLAAELRARRLRAVVIGGSAGGVEAASELLSQLPAALSVPIILVLHVGAATKPRWSAVFSRSTLPVREAEDKDIAQPGAVYVAPADYHLLIDEQARLSLSLDERVHLARPSIDVLFESAAWAYGDALLGIVLSGANADGARGLETIHQRGGLCWVQAPATATAMPNAALRAVPDARVMSLAQMIEAFAKLEAK